MRKDVIGTVLMGLSLVITAACLFAVTQGMGWIGLVLLMVGLGGPAVGLAAGACQLMRQVRLREREVESAVNRLHSELRDWIKIDVPRKPVDGKPTTVALLIETKIEPPKPPLLLTVMDRFALLLPWAIRNRDFRPHFEEIRIDYARERQRCRGRGSRAWLAFALACRFGWAIMACVRCLILQYILFFLPIGLRGWWVSGPAGSSNTSRTSQDLD